MLAVFIWLVFGLIVGLIAKALMAKRHKSGMLATILLGVGGAFVGGLISRIMFGFGFTVPNSSEDLVLPSFLLSLLFAILGAMVLSAIFQIRLNSQEE